VSNYDGGGVYLGSFVSIVAKKYFEKTRWYFLKALIIIIIINHYAPIENSRKNEEI
jgi:hypothetical protein